MTAIGSVPTPNPAAANPAAANPKDSGVRALRRGQIIEAARALVAADGVAALTIGELERRLPFSRGVITYHFANKAAIVDAVLDSALADIDATTRAEVVARADAKDKLAAALHGMVAGFLGNPEASAVLLSFWSRIATETRAREVNARLYRGWRESTAGILEAGMARGELAVAPIKPLAALLVGMVIGVVTQAFFDPDGVDPDGMVAEAVAALSARLAV